MAGMNITDILYIEKHHRHFIYRKTSPLAQCCIMPQQRVALKVIFMLLPRTGLNVPLEYYFTSE